jgi:hypothetical protein
VCRKFSGAQHDCEILNAVLIDKAARGQGKREMTTVTEKIDAKLVKELREKSGAPMGDCLKAL